MGSSMSPQAPPGVGSDVQVTLPAALGGGVRTTRHTSSAPPVLRHITNVPLVAATNAPVGSVRVANATTSAAAPTSVDLSGSAPPPGDQGQTGSCQAWATGYTALGWWANQDGVPNAAFAPMYLYAQYAQGNCSVGAYIEQPLAMLQAQGIDTAEDYEPMENNLDCGTQPTSAEQTNAARFAISGYLQNDQSAGVTAAITSTLAAGYPITLTITVYPEFDNANASDYLVGPPQPGDVAEGGHAITAFAYDANGVWIENSWGTGWGTNGWAELSWDFVTGGFDGQVNVADLATITGAAFSCSDDNIQCAVWAATSQCQDNPGWMLPNCCASCANPNPCVDTNSNCPAWAAENQCTINPDYMQPYCCYSCFGV